MDYTVTFHNLITEISIDPSLSFNQARFIYGNNGGLVNPDNGRVYPSIRGIEIHGHLDHIPEEGRKNQEEIETALYIAEEIITGLVATTQCECYLAKPYTATYNDKSYVLTESHWTEYTPEEHWIRGGEVFLDKVDFIDVPKNFHPMFHFYRAAKDETNPIDYRALNAWRFLEALHGLRDRNLVDFLINNDHQPPQVVDRFYKNIRCAVAHAQRLKADPASTEVIVPRSYEIAFDGGLALDLMFIIEYLDKIVKELSPVPDNTSR